MTHEEFRKELDRLNYEADVNARATAMFVLEGNTECALIQAAKFDTSNAASQALIAAYNAGELQLA